ncbi:hypothetical protein Aple_059270 [Acrocarpospora pleiomorpha]|uniref:Uncharacterized protein n=1 Tax=Acrocarpospora pleiomorpha TaxID=90975 RepID=A0A5M3XXK1_9ACTN|nr:hypothetical protein Aple_059270 [Acrocarpospora pleiomorpha]
MVTDITPLWYAPPIALPTTLLLIPTVLTLATLLAIHPIRRVTRYFVGTCLRAA